MMPSSTETDKPGSNNRFVAGVLAVIVAFSSFQSLADQNDPRLDALFSKLSRSADPREAQALERSIWSLWLSISDSEAAQWLDEGIRAMSSGRVDEAIDRFDRIIEKAPGFAEGWNKRATASYLRQDYGASMRDIQRTLALEPRHFGAISGMGMILMATGDPGSAIKAFEEVLRIHPNASGARHYLQQLRKALEAEGA